MTHSVKLVTIENHYSKRMNITHKLEEVGDYILPLAKKFTFKSSELPDTNDFKTDIVKHPIFSSFFNELLDIKENCVYWFSTDSVDKCKTLNDLLNVNRESLTAVPRIVPPDNKNVNSNILYVGMRLGGFRKRDDFTHIAGRMVQHLGYYEKGSTQGLQLVHWAKPAKIDITINFVPFNDLPNQLLVVLEGILAHQLKPLCGKH